MAIIIIAAEKADHEIYRSLSLEKEGVAECNFSEAGDVISKCHFNLAILDCGVEVNKGMELLKELKTDHPGIPIIFVTDISSNDVVLKAFKTGARDFFKKPLNLCELWEMIRGVLSIKRTTRETRSRFKSVISSPVKLPEKTISLRFGNLAETLCYIERNLSDRISLDNIAQQAHISKSHFYKLFKKRTGQSLSKFVTAMRIEKAKELFRRNDLSIWMAAINVGFNDYIIFTKHFKRLTGMTPSTYKRSLKVGNIDG